MQRHLPTTRITLVGALLSLVGCVPWPGQSGVHAFSPGLSLREDPPACRTVLRGVLWPPADQPTFAVGGRRIVVSSAGVVVVSPAGVGVASPANVGVASPANVVVAEAETDRRGRFELAIKEHGPYTISFTTSSSTSASASASVELAVSPCGTKRIDLVAHLD